MGESPILRARFDGDRRSGDTVEQLAAFADGEPFVEENLGRPPDHDPGENDRTVLRKAVKRRIFSRLLKNPQANRADGLGEKADEKELPPGAKHFVPFVPLPIGLHVEMGVKGVGQDLDLRLIRGAVVQMHDNAQGTVQREFFGAVRDIVCDVGRQPPRADGGGVKAVERLIQSGKAHRDRIGAGLRNWHQCSFMWKSS